MLGLFYCFCVINYFFSHFFLSHNHIFLFFPSIWPPILPRPKVDSVTCNSPRLLSANRRLFNFSPSIFMPYFCSQANSQNISSRTQLNRLGDSTKVDLLSYFSTYIIIFQKWQSLEPPISTSGRDRDKQPPSCFVGNLILNNFYLKQFLI